MEFVPLKGELREDHNTLIALDVPPVLMSAESVMEPAEVNLRVPVKGGAAPVGVIWRPNVKASTLTP